MTASDHHRPRTSTSGWVVFSATMIFLAAAANLIYGITMLVNDEWVVLGVDEILIFDLTTVGVIALLFAAFQLFVGMGVLGGELWARILGIIFAALNALAQMAFISVYAEWSWLLLVIDVLIIYGLTVHGDEVAEI
jgi:hypothetical protein